MVARNLSLVMTYNTVFNEESQEDDQNSQQDEWTPYTAWGNLSSGYGKRDVWGNCFDNNCSSTFKQNIHDKEDLLILSKKVLNVPQTLTLWNSIVGNCCMEKTTYWLDSIENINFRRSLSVPYKAKLSVKERFTWNFKCYGCQGKKLLTRNSGEEFGVYNIGVNECCSQCFSHNFYISKHGMVFSNQEEKHIFDDKMEKMNQLLKSELHTIREQHNRLQLISTKEDNKEMVVGRNEEEPLETELSSKDNEIDEKEYDLNFFEDQQRSEPSIFDGFKGLLNNINISLQIT